MLGYAILFILITWGVDGKREALIASALVAVGTIGWRYIS